MNWQVWSSWRKYLPTAFFLLALLAAGGMLLPGGPLSGKARYGFFAFAFGSLVGFAEIASRYRDEPLLATISPFGLIYLAFNGSISVASLVLILRFKTQFPAISADPFLAALAAGFGSMAIMRTRLAVVKGADNKEISVGPDFVITVLLTMLDTKIDRLRAQRRQELVIRHFSAIKKLGTFERASTYLLVSLLAFQHLDEALKKQLSDVVESYKTKTLPDDIKFLALGFAFLTIVGEENFAEVLRDAQRFAESGAQSP